MQFTPEVFNPNVADLQLIVEQTKEITRESGEDKVKEIKNKLVKARTTIQKIGKDERASALKYQKEVIGYEKSLLAIIEPEEVRLKGILDEIETERIKEARKAALPVRIEALKSIGDDIEVEDDILLEMDDNRFIEYKNERITAFQEKKQAELEAKERALREKEEEAKREAEAAEREERARQQERERIEREQKEADERKEREKRSLAAQKKYQEFLKFHGCDQEHKADFQIVDQGAKVVLYKKVGEYIK